MSESTKASSWVSDISVSSRASGAERKAVTRPPNYRKQRHGGAGRTPAQDEVAAYISERLRAGSSPTVDEIRKHMGWKAADSARSCLRNMAMNGKLPRGFDRSVLLSKRR